MHSAENTESGLTIGKIVAVNFRTAEVFKKYGIDFCCKGNRLLVDVCKEKKLDFAAIEEEVLVVMEALQSIPEDQYKSMPLDELATHIESSHHTYVRQSIPVLLGYLNKINKVHGDRHPELDEIYQLFDGCATELTHHMVKEETILFPAIKKMAEAARNNHTIPPFFFGSLQNPINMMEQEHTVEGDRLFRIAALSNNFIAPADGCTTYNVAFQKLQEFQNDLFQHIHLENNILFPKSIELEKVVEFS